MTNYGNLCHRKHRKTYFVIQPGKGHLKLTRKLTAHKVINLMCVSVDRKKKKKTLATYGVRDILKYNIWNSHAFSSLVKSSMAFEKPNRKCPLCYQCCKPTCAGAQSLGILWPRKGGQKLQHVHNGPPRAWPGLVPKGSFEEPQPGSHTLLRKQLPALDALWGSRLCTWAQPYSLHYPSSLLFKEGIQIDNPMGKPSPCR